jgi:hypothetical protein
MNMFRKLANTSAVFGIVGAVSMMGVGSAHAERISFGMGKKACAAAGGVWNYSPGFGSWGCGTPFLHTKPGSAKKATKVGAPVVVEKKSK